jgi:hypothetical protein
MEIIAYIGLIILLGLTVFQILLITGKPLGDFAWGGQHKVLPRNLRIASVSSIVLYIVFAIFLASKVGIINIVPSSQLLDTMMWIFTAYFILGIPLNAISRNKKERNLMTPVVIALAILFLVVSLPTFGL